MDQLSACYLNGEFQPLAEATVSVLDRGFIFGDGIYEMIPVFSGHAFRLKEHLQRLVSSLDAIHIKNPHSLSEWADLIETLIQKKRSRTSGDLLTDHTGRCTS